MTTQRSLLEHAAGKLIAAVQREWHAELGEPGAAASEHVMHACHDLLNAAKDGSLPMMLRNTCISDVIGRTWTAQHPTVQPAIEALEEQLKRDAAGNASAPADGTDRGGPALKGRRRPS
ncbi:hypothetical protein BSY238_196 [Methyloversatilis sp. RAC08]|uniref:hypothetical protein n=1 Tax=Methyloversatilis sp. RAC08 TaxID=1842540 RepID=UPI0008565A44|nr:hypothetical protein [Methyloversatilis sp. RAC08]AOF82852.1 hypothetical protein BSY238_196 [Methyloversatilis sp. RAC08]